MVDGSGPAPSSAPQPIPGPVIEPSNYGQSIVTSGFIEITVKSLGGNSACSVSSVKFTTVNTMTNETTAYSAANVERAPATIRLRGMEEALF